MKRRFAVVCLVIGFALLLGLICPRSDAADQKVITLKFSESNFPATHRFAMLMADWCKEVEKRTDGRVKIDFFPGGILAPTTQVFDSVKKGIADLGDSFASYTKGRFPLIETIDLPYGYKSSAMGTHLTNEFYNKFKPKEYDDVKIMFFYTAGPQMLDTKKEVTKLEEVKGLKIRSTGSSAKIVEHLGGAPVGMPMGDAYDALARGVVNGVVGPLEVMKGWKLAEVLSFSTNYGCLARQRGLHLHEQEQVEFDPGQRPEDYREDQYRVDRKGGKELGRCGQGRRRCARAEGRKDHCAACPGTGKMEGRAQAHV